MTRSRAVKNRRHESRRQYLPRAPVAWRRHGAAMWRRGWLNDISVSGASLLVSTQGQPNAGQEIDLLPRYSGQAVLCRVVRTRIREDDQGLVACRIVSADGCPALLGPALNAGTARQQALGRAWPPGLWMHSPHDVACRRSA
jgi:hypothetical protein